MHMTASSSAEPSSTDLRDAINKDILKRWDRLSATDVAAMTSVDELIRKVGSKYGQDRTNARIDVGALLKGRTL
jgi:hypothetical protein